MTFGNDKLAAYVMDRDVPPFEDLETRCRDTLRLEETEDDDWNYKEWIELASKYGIDVISQFACQIYERGGNPCYGCCKELIGKVEWTCQQCAIQTYETVLECQMTATHEAGHAVIGRVLGYPCGEATTRSKIYPDRPPLALDGRGPHSDHSSAQECLQSWWDSGKFRANEVETHADIIISMAGCEAEVMVFGPPSSSGDREVLVRLSDRENIQEGLEKLHLTDPEKWEARFRRITQRLVRIHRPKIEALAEVLAEKEVLTGAEIDRLVGRSFRDVRGFYDQTKQTENYNG